MNSEKIWQASQAELRRHDRHWFRQVVVLLRANYRRGISARAIRWYRDRAGAVLDCPNRLVYCGLASGR